MTTDSLLAFIDRAWPIVVVAVPATWGAAKLYYDREIRILERRLAAAEADLRGGRAAPAVEETQRATASSVPSGLAPGRPRHASLTLEEVLTLQSDARSVLAAIRHLQDQLKSELAAPSDTTRVGRLRAETALARAANAYERIRREVVDMRDRLLIHAPPKAHVQRHPLADAQYTAPTTAESLALIERDLSLLCLSLSPDGGYG